MGRRNLHGGGGGVVQQQQRRGVVEHVPARAVAYARLARGAPRPHAVWANGGPPSLRVGVALLKRVS